jgi:hypothetical protein
LNTENPLEIGEKKRQAYYIAPLQPLTLAAFPPWEGSAGAGRVRPAGCKDRDAETIYHCYLKVFCRLLSINVRLMLINYP